MILAHGLTSDDYFYFFVYPIIWIVIFLAIVAAPLIVNFILKNKKSKQLSGKQIFIFYLLILVQVFYYDLQSPLEIERKHYTLTLLMLLPLFYVLNFFICTFIFKEKIESTEPEDREGL